ncbi:MAG: hypothetical protein GX059_08145 [Clostridiales bacterium]|nr:hypothetical protein [Clostridiales bacterium]
MISVHRFKSILIKGFVLLFFIMMLVFPHAAYKGAASGLMLWFLNVLPTLLPFIIVSNLMIKINIADKISTVLYPVLGKLFKVSSRGSYPILVGFLSGMPMGAKTVADMYSDNRLDSDEARFLLGMCNNVSPVFILNYIAVNQLNMPETRVPLFAIVFGSSIISSVIVRRCHDYYIKRKQAGITLSAASVSKSHNSRQITFSFEVLDKSIMNGFEVITRIGGYIILFSILAQITNEIVPSIGFGKAFLMGIFEITTGIAQICRVHMDGNIKIVLVSFLAAFGGLSGLAQTKSVLGESRLSIKTYIKTKMLSSIIAVLFSLLYVLFLKG